MAKPNATRDQQIAEHGTILRGPIGSRLHGVTTAGSDRDEMGVCIEPPEFVTGLETFEQYTFRSQRRGTRSAPGDLELTVYSLRKWAHLAAAGNPTVLLLGFVPADQLVVASPAGLDLQQHMDWFVSDEAAAKFIGYCRSQYAAMRGERGTVRPELVDSFGYDTKYAYHAIRLAVQGREFLSDGTITLPMPEPWREWLIGLRAGAVSYRAACDAIDEQLWELRQLKRTADLPPVARRADINAWLHRTYLAGWAEVERG